MADATLGRGDGAQKCRVVIVIGPQAQPCTKVADFGAIKKTLPAGHLVGNTCFAQGFFKGPGLVVSAVEHRKVAQLFELHARLRQCALGAQTLDARHHALGFVVFAISVHHTHRLAFAQIAP